MGEDPGSQSILDIATRVMAMEKHDDIVRLVEKLREVDITVVRDLHILNNDAMESKLRNRQPNLTSVEIGHIKGFLKAVQQSQEKSEPRAEKTTESS